MSDKMFGVDWQDLSEQPRPQPQHTTPQAAEQQYATPPAAGQQHTKSPVPPKRRTSRGIAALAIVGVLAAGIGGGTGVVVDRALQPAQGETSAQPSTVTKIVQGSAGNTDWTDVANAVSRSVVSIIVSAGQSGDEGTGVLLDAKGSIVTNNHVISGAGQGATIQVQMGSSLYAATVVGTDPSTDLAVIRITNPPKNLTPITFADSSNVAVGDSVMAIGNPLGLSGTATTGIVSALNRPVVTQGVTTAADRTGGSSNVYTSAIQTSAPINPGNSGGALVNASGELIGINAAIASLSQSSTSQSGSIGIGFAIPSNLVKYITEQLVSGGPVQHAYLGISTDDGTATVGTAEVQGARISSIVAGSPAATVGLQRGDVITAVNGVTVYSADGLIGQVRASRVGEQMTLTVVRGGSTITVTATPTAAPSA